MAAAVVNSRKIAMEDLQTTGVPGTTFNADVLTPTGPVTTALTAIPITPLTLLGVYANDAAAAAAAVAVGECYIKSGNGKLATRMV